MRSVYSKFQFSSFKTEGEDRGDRRGGSRTPIWGLSCWFVIWPLSYIWLSYWCSWGVLHFSTYRKWAATQISVYNAYSGHVIVTQGKSVWLKNSCNIRYLQVKNNISNWSLGQVLYCERCQHWDSKILCKKTWKPLAKLRLKKVDRGFGTIFKVFCGKPVSKVASSCKGLPPWPYDPRPDATAICQRALWFFKFWNLR